MMIGLALGLIIVSGITSFLLLLVAARQRHRRAVSAAKEYRRRLRYRDEIEQTERRQRLRLVAGGPPSHVHGIDSPLADRVTGPSGAGVVGSATDKTPDPPASLPDERGSHVT